MKKLILLLVLSLFMCPALAEETLTEGSYTYELLGDGTARLTGCTSTEANLTLPATLGGAPVTVIASKAIRDVSPATLTIPEGVTTLEANAVYYIQSLQSVHLPDSLICIEGNPFYSCGRLSSITVSADHPTLAVVDGVLFSKADNMLLCYPRGLTATTYAIPHGVNTISDYAFHACNQLTSITFPDTLTGIGDNAFNYCESLTGIALPDSLLEIGEQAFFGCKKLTTVDLPGSLQTLGSVAFGWSGVQCASLPASLTSVGANPFYGCTSLHSVTLDPANPALMTEDSVLYSGADMRAICCCDSTNEDIHIAEGTLCIGDYAFYDCRHMNSVTLPEGLASIGNAAFYDCINLTAIDLPSTCTEVGELAFRGCRRLTEISFPEGMTILRINTLSHCSGLMRITLPETLITIEDYALSDCNPHFMNLPTGLASIGQGNFASDCATRFSVSRGSYAEQYCIQQGFTIQYAFHDFESFFN